METLAFNPKPNVPQKIYDTCMSFPQLSSGSVASNWMQLEFNARIVLMTNLVEPGFLIDGMIERCQATIPLTATPVI